MSTKKKSSPESIVRQIKRKTRRKYSAEEKIRIVLEGLSGHGFSPLGEKSEGLAGADFPRWGKSVCSDPSNIRLVA